MPADPVPVSPAQAGPPSTPVTAGDGTAWARFLSLAAIWGSSYLFIRIGLDEGIAPLMMVSLRAFFGAAFLALVMWWRGGGVPATREGWWRMSVLAVTNVVIPFALIAWGLQYIPTGMGGILNAIVPLFVIVLAAFVLHDEPITVGRLGGLLIGFLGVVLLAFPNLRASIDGSDAVLALAGMLAMAAASFSYAVAAVYTRNRLTGQPLMRSRDGSLRAPTALEIAFGGLAIAFAMMAVITIVFERPSGGLVALPQNADAWFSMLWLGVLGTGLAYLLFFGLIARWGATRTTIVTYVIPVIAIALGYFLLGERLRPIELLGAVLIIGGVAIVNSTFGRRRLFGRATAPS